MGSTVIAIPDGESTVSAPKKKNKLQFCILSFISALRENETKKIIHSIKVGVALVLVSLIFILDPLYEEVRDNNAMWPIMTVVVIFEFYTGATLSKGLNRGIGTVLGGGLGCLAANLVHQVGGYGNSIVVGICVFIFGGAATYCRLNPSIKKTYDYGVLIFILTFNLVAVSGLREEDVMEIARERLLMILMGFAICICTSLFIFPMWASHDLHDSTVSKFQDLATSIEGCLEEYFRFAGNKENQPAHPNFASFRICKSVLYSKSKDESLGIFASWEPWHGKFGLSYPWEKHQNIMEVLQELATTILSFKGCLQSPKQSTQTLRESIKEPCEAVGTSLACSLRELGESIQKMRKCQPDASILPKLRAARTELSHVMSPSRLQGLENVDSIPISSFLLALMGMVDKLEELAKEVQQLGELAGFRQG